MATLGIQNATATITYAAANGGGDKIPPGDRVYLAVDNRSGGAITVTIDSPATCEFGAAANAAHDLVKSVAAGETQFLGPVTSARFRASDGLAAIGYTTPTNLFVAAVEV